VSPCTAYALVFDMDGLMVDSEPVWFELQAEFVRTRGGEWTTELAGRCAGGGLVNALRVIERTFAIDVDVDRECKAMADAFAERVERLSLKSGCAELLDAADEHGIPCAVGSSSTTGLVETVLRRFGLSSRFRAVVTGDLVPRAKPAPDVFLEASARLGVPPEGCVVLEDALAGVAAARAAGMRVIAVPERAAHAFEGLADFVVPDLHAARRLLGL
jgi:beta-phosphoglucomutase-like phosphatase (HAD superfamily)